MLRWRFQSGVGAGQAVIPGGQLTMLSVLSDTVETEVRIHTLDPIIVPANAYFTIGAQEFGYLYRVCVDKTGRCYGSQDCDEFPGDQQITISFLADNEPGGPLTWFVAWVGC